MSAIHIFTRDLRKVDNTGFIRCCQNFKIIAPVFIFTKEQVDRKNNTYFSANAVQFMIESLTELRDRDFTDKMTFMYGSLDNCLKKICSLNGFDAVYMTKDYTPFAKSREKILQKWCDKFGKKCVISEDYCLYNPCEILTGSGDAYQKYTPYKNACLKSGLPNKVSKVNLKIKFVKINGSNGVGSLEFDLDNALKKFASGSLGNRLNRRGGRIAGLKLIKDIDKLGDYGDKRDDLEGKTSELSAYIKFGCVSIREVFWRVKNLFGIKHGLIGQLIWHDFYYQLGYAFDKVMKGKALKDKYDGIKWKNKKSDINAWKGGRTGFPIVDAGMRQLNETGYMHNRSRLIVASFLVKTLLVDWRVGEKYFAQQLEDYDPLVNNGNWQWVSGSGADSQPYFRIFNPFSQTERFDGKGIYIKKWVKELGDYDGDGKDFRKWEGKVWSKYPKMIVDYKSAKKDVLKAYKKVV